MAYVYADLAAILKTELFKRILTSVTLLTQGSLGKQATDCVTQWVGAAREVAAAGDDRQQLVIVSYEPSALNTPLSKCIQLVDGWQPIKLANAAEAYSLHQNVLAFSGGTAVIGNRALVEASLGNGPRGTWPKELLLAKDRQLVFSGRIDKESTLTSGYLSVGGSHFAIHGDVTFPSEAAARSAAEAAAPATVRRQLLDQTPFGDPQLGDKVMEHWRVEQKQRSVQFEFRTEGAPETMAQQIGFISAAGIFGFRRYLANAKANEARVTIRAIADRIVVKHPRKLVSLPPVPKEFELLQGGKYRSSAQDWAAWSPIEFALTEPQYYQYRVNAGRDGKSALIIAEGDLNGDGKRSRFTLSLKTNPKTHELQAAPHIDERDPLE